MQRSQMVTPDDLAYLRTQTLRAVVLCFTAALYLCCVVLLQTESRFGDIECWRHCQMLWITPQWRRMPMESERISDLQGDHRLVAIGPVHLGT